MSTRARSREWSRAGHEVVVFCQEPHPQLYDVGEAEIVRPDIGGLLPVFVLDRYEGLEARRLPELSQAEREHYVDANAAALRERLPTDLVFANHVLLGGPVAAATGARYAVKAHGSELEYAMRGNEDLSVWGRAGLMRAEAVFVGSEHIREVLEDVVGHVDPCTRCRPASTSTSSSSVRGRRRFAGSFPRAARTRRTRATRTSGYPMKAMRNGSGLFSPATSRRSSTSAS